jgi:hypothetical protein
MIDRNFREQLRSRAGMILRKAGAPYFGEAPMAKPDGVSLREQLSCQPWAGSING